MFGRSSARRTNWRIRCAQDRRPTSFCPRTKQRCDRLEEVDLLLTKSRRAIAKNGLAIIAHANSAPIKSPKELLGPRFKRLVLAEPACPLGQYAQDYLKRAGYTKKFQGKYYSSTIRERFSRRWLPELRTPASRLPATPLAAEIGSCTARPHVASRNDVHRGADSTGKMPGWRRAVARFSYVPNGESLLPKVRARNRRCCQSSSLTPS